MKSTRYLVVVPAALALALAGCGGSTGSSDTPAATGATAAGAPADDSNCASADVFCLGLVTDTGKVDDKSFNQSAHEGAQAAAKEATASTSTSRPRTPRTTRPTSRSSPTRSTTRS